MRKVLTVMLSAVFFCSLVLFAACGETESAKEPVAKTGAEFSISLDIYTQNLKTKVLKMSDYFDENGAEDIAYKAAVTGDAVKLSATAVPANKQITVTAEKAGTAKVTLSAEREGEAKATAEITFTVANSSPWGVSYPTGAILDVVSFEGAVEAARNAAFTFAVTPTDDYVPGTEPIKAFYTVAGGTEKEVAGSPVADTDSYGFTIPAGDVTGAIAILDVTGFIPNDAPQSAVALIDATGKDFTIAGSGHAYTNKNYLFTVTVPSYYEAPTVTYDNGEDPAVDGLTGAGVADGAFMIYTFTVPKEELKESGILTVSDVSLTLKAPVNIRDAFYAANAETGVATNWKNLTDDTASATRRMPTVTEDVLSVNDKVWIENSVSDPGWNGNASNNWNKLSFMLKSSGDFSLIFFATGSIRVSETGFGFQTGNWLNFRLYQGKLSLATAQMTLATRLTEKNATAWKTDEWVQVDFLYRGLGKIREGAGVLHGSGEFRLFIDGKWVEMGYTATNGLDARATVVNGNFNWNFAQNASGGGSVQNWGNRICADAGETTPIFFKKVVLPA